MKNNNLLFKQELIQKIMELSRLNQIYDDYKVELEYYDFIDLYG